MILFLKRLALFAAFMFLGLEIVFRTVIPAADMPAGHQDPEYMIMRLDLESKRDGHNSMGRFGRPRFRWHINNFGFNSAYDYRAPAERDEPCVVVIGNSYTQGLYSDVEDHLAGQLQTAMGPGVAVYNLGTSGMPLSQCPLVVAYAREAFEPDLIVIQAGTGSLDRCLRENGMVPYCRQYVWREDRLTALPPSRFIANRRNRLMRKSALVRYLFYNSNFNLGGQGNVEQAVQAPSPGEAATRTTESTRVLGLAVNEVLGEMREMVPDTPILIVFDADRAALYDKGAAPDRLRNSPLLEEACGEHGIHFADMTGPFAEEYLKEKRKFNFDDNYHWNAYGVGIVTRTIMSKLEAENLFDGGLASPAPQKTE